jgi:hypothetical protein
MFGFLKKKDKEQSGAGEELEWGGVTTNRKMSASQAAKEEAEQKAIDLRSKERRDNYCHPGVERVFNDAGGRHIALRIEDNTGANPSAVHPPVNFAAYWGARQIGGAKAELKESSLHIYFYETVNGYEQRGVSVEILRDAETFARNKGLKAIIAALPQNGVNDWDENLFNQAGFANSGEKLQKNL